MIFSLVFESFIKTTMAISEIKEKSDFRKFLSRLGCCFVFFPFQYQTRHDSLKSNKLIPLVRSFNCVSQFFILMFFDFKSNCLKTLSKLFKSDSPIDSPFRRLD